MMGEMPSEALSHAGAVVDQAISHMVGQEIGSLEIASALLAGALSLLGRSLAQDAVLQVLEQARAAVAAGRFAGAAGG